MADRKRIRRRKHAEAVAPDTKQKEMRKLALATEEVQDQIRLLQNELGGNIKKMFEYMEAYKITEVDANFGTYKYEIPAGRSSTEIHTEDLYNHMELEEFLQCVKASVTKVKEFLGEKELKDISTRHAGKPGEPRVAYKPKKT